MVFCKRNRKATEAALRSAAVRLFAQKGYENTRTLEIAKEAKVNEALIARYFGGKEGLLLSILKEDSGGFLLDSDSFQLSSTAIPAPGTGGSLKDALLLFFKAGEERVREHENFMRIALSRSLLDSETAKAVREKLIDRFRMKVEEGLRGYLQGRGATNSDLEAIAMLVAASNHTFHFLCKRVHQMDAERADRALRVLAESLEAYLESRERTRTRSVTTNA